MSGPTLRNLLVQAVNALDMGQEVDLIDLEQSVLRAVKVDALVKAAWGETMRRYPDAAGALTFFLCASGMNAGVVTPEAEAWRDAALAPASGGVEPCADYPNCPPNQTCDRCAGRGPALGNTEGHSAPVDALVKRLCVAAQDMVTVARQDGWAEATTGRQIVLRAVQDALAAIREGRK